MCIRDRGVYRLRDIINISRCGGIGRRTRLKIVRETIWVRLPSAALVNNSSEPFIRFRAIYILPSEKNRLKHRSGNAIMKKYM
jgi:hypothetical protein